MATGALPVATLTPSHSISGLLPNSSIVSQSSKPGSVSSQIFFRVLSMLIPVTFKRRSSLQAQGAISRQCEADGRAFAPGSTGGGADALDVAQRRIEQVFHRVAQEAARQHRARILACCIVGGADAHLVRTPAQHRGAGCHWRRISQALIAVA